MPDRPKLTPEEFRRRLEILVRAGQLTEEQAQQQIAAYKKQHEAHEAQRQRAQNNQGRRAPQRPGRQQGGRQHGQQGNRPPRTTSWNDVKGYAHSPYVFVPLNEHIQPPENVWLDEDGNLRPRNEPLPDGCCAEIDIRIIPETPICIGHVVNNVVSPVRINGNWVIPGSTLRGYFRSFLQTLAFGRLWPFNFRQSFGLRDFMHPYYSGEEGPAVSRATEVKAGWLLVVDGEWQITPCRKWGYINIEESGLFGWPYWLKKSREEKYRQFDMVVVRNGKPIFDFSINKFKNFQQDGDRAGVPVYRPVNGGNEKGCYVFAGPFPLPRTGPNKRTKRYEYVFFEDEKAKPISLKPDAIERFKAANGRVVGNRIEKQGGWADFEATLDAGMRVPVFYVGDLKEQGQDFAFGFTRMFKVTHRFSVGDKAEETNSAHLPAGDVEERDGEYVFRPDFVENLFGFVLEPEQLRALNYNYDPQKLRGLQRQGRISFGFAIAEDSQAFEQGGTVRTIMGGPQPSFAPFYLTGKIKDWSNPHSRLAGRKRYVPRYSGTGGQPRIHEHLQEQVTRAQAGLKPGQTLSEKVFTSLRLLKPRENAVFKGRIRLFNVTPVELGAVLWALTFGGNDKYRHMLGHAKPFGAGQVRMELANLTVRPNNPDSWTYDNAADVPARCKPFMQAFEDFMKEAWEAEPEVKKCLLEACDPSNWTQWRGYPEFPKGFADLRKALQMKKDESRQEELQRLAGAPQGPLLPACKQ